MDDVQVYFGSAVKALGNGRVGGHLALFTSAQDPDLDRDYFDAQTDFDLDEEIKSVRVLYDHGLDPIVKARKLGRGRITTDKLGLWIEAQLELRDDYEKAIYQLAEAGKLGWSSGSAPHLIQREAVGKSHYVKSWPIIEASLTAKPTEPRTSAVALKSLEHIEFSSLLAELQPPAGEPVAVKAEISLAGLPALQQVIAPADLQGIAARSESVETAVKEFLKYGQLVSDVIKSHLARVDSKIEFRYVKDGRVQDSHVKHVETMLQDVGKLDQTFQTLQHDLQRLKVISTDVKSREKLLDEAARFEFWKFLRSSGKSAKEIEQ